MLGGNDDAYDTVVVGCGIAGLSATVKARELGAKVAVLERSPREERGGNTRWTDALLRMKNESEAADDLISQIAANAGHHLDPGLVAETPRRHADWPSIVKVLNFSDPEIVSTLAARAGPTLQWLKRFGIKFETASSYFITTSTTRLAPAGGGLAMIEALAGWAEANGVEFFYRTTAQGLVRDGSGAVRGVNAVGAGDAPMLFKARSVVLASGGFEGNPEMLTQYIGPEARYLRPVARGGYYNKGEGIRMALAIGAAPAGDFGSIHAEPLDPRSARPEPIVLVFNYGILVNKLGRRFIDEAPSTVDATYEAITRVILTQPGGIAYAIFDARIDDVPGWKRSVRSDQPPISAPTLAELAAVIGTDAVALQTTVDAFNAACPEGAFKPLEADNLRTDSNYFPGKSNWSRPIDKPPFMAYPIICGNCFTFGGIKINAHSEVLNADGEVIPGLYAAGEMTGLYFGTYTGSTSVLRGAVFGHIAGEQAVRRAQALAENLRLG
jgi:tricarballylate dehydrogenase